MEQQSRQKTGRFRIKDTFYTLYIVFYIRLPTHQVMFDRRHLSADFPSQRFIGCYYVQFILHTWFALLVFSFFDFVPAIWIRRIHDNNTHHHAGNNNFIYTLWYTPRLRLLLKNSYSIYSTIGYWLRNLFLDEVVFSKGFQNDKWCLEKRSKLVLW